MTGNPVRRQSRTADFLRSQWIPLLLIPVAIVLIRLLFLATERWLDWPTTDRERDMATYVTIGVALLPALVYLANRGFGFLSDKGAQFEASAMWASLKVDFSERAERARTTRDMQIPANISPRTIGDSGSHDILEAIKRASSLSVVTLDLADGRAWWSTRLLALAAGAVRQGRPETLVFLATVGGVEQAYVGLTNPERVLDAILDFYPNLRSRYRAAMSDLHVQQAIKPKIAQPPYGSPDQSTDQYWNQFSDVSVSSFMGHLMNRVSSLEPYPNQEPDPGLLVTSSRLVEILAPYLETDTVETGLPLDQQIDRILGCSAPYIAAVRDGSFVGLINVDAVTRSAVRHLVQSAAKPPDVTARE